MQLPADEGGWHISDLLVGKYTNESFRRGKKTNARVSYTLIQLSHMFTPLEQSVIIAILSVIVLIVSE